MSTSRTLRSLGLWGMLLGFGCADIPASVGFDASTTDVGTSTDPSSTSSGTTSQISESAGDSSGDGLDCGDGMLDPQTEECDGSDLGGATCASEGFSGGILLCLADCSFDTTACSVCGDGLREAEEDCDGDELGGADCASEGFGGGVLSCGMDCAFDVSGCDPCGNAIVDEGEACDGDDMAGQSCPGLGRGFTGGVLTCDAACSLNTAGCTSHLRPDASGQVLITEIMQNPAAVADAEGEYFELYNPSGADTYQLQGCAVEGNVNDTGFEIDADLAIGPGSYVTLASSSAAGPGFDADFAWPPSVFGLNNASDRVAVVCEGIVIDEVVYDDGATFPDPNGASMNLDPDWFDAAANDVGAAWCAATSSFGPDDGTPGTANDQCAGAVVHDIGFCRLQFPTDFDAPIGVSVDVFGRVYVAGVTDQTGGNDPVPALIGGLGFGPDGSDPAADAGWTWIAAGPNPGYGPGGPGYEPANDEYVASLTIPEPGNYDLAFRFSGDGGQTFTYCDGQSAGSSDGYAAVDAGQLVATPPRLYFTEYLEGAGNDKAVEVFNGYDGAAYDLDDCEVRFYFNGSSNAGTIIALGGALAPLQTHVLCDAGIADAGGCDQTDGDSFFSGDDAVELRCGGETYDVIGQIGVDPGSQWQNAGGTVGTSNQGLRRSCSVTTGDADGTNAFDPGVEWTSHAGDDFGDLGQYTCP